MPQGEVGAVIAEKIDLDVAVAAAVMGDGGMKAHVADLRRALPGLGESAAQHRADELVRPALR